jgi:hypothetical protein
MKDVMFPVSLTAGGNFVLIYMNLFCDSYFDSSYDTLKP